MSIFLFSRQKAAFFPLDKTRLLVGGHAGLSRVSSSGEDRKFDETLPRTTFSIGPAVGGEYDLGEHFSIADHFTLGIEVCFAFVNFGAPGAGLEGVPPSQFRTSGVASLHYNF
jgi:hypothetical protein